MIFTKVNGIVFIDACSVANALRMQSLLRKGTPGFPDGDPDLDSLADQITRMADGK